VAPESFPNRAHALVAIGRAAMSFRELGSLQPDRISGEMQCASRATTHIGSVSRKEGKGSELATAWSPGPHSAEGLWGLRTIEGVIAV
jgi:hypothetical protein